MPVSCQAFVKTMLNIAHDLIHVDAPLTSTSFAGSLDQCGNFLRNCGFFNGTGKAGKLFTRNSRATQRRTSISKRSHAIDCDVETDEPLVMGFRFFGVLFIFGATAGAMCFLEIPLNR